MLRLSERGARAGADRGCSFDVERGGMEVRRARFAFHAAEAAVFAVLIVVCACAHADRVDAYRLTVVER